METLEKNWNIQVNHPLQSWEWGEFRKIRQPISRINGMLVMWSRIPFTPWYFGYIPMGKLPDEQDIKALIIEGRRMKAIGIRMEPNLPAGRQMPKELVMGRLLFKQKTYVLDLTRSEEELLKNMHPKGRYNIRVAQKHRVRVREDNSDTTFGKYLDLMFGGTVKRQRIYSHSREYHSQMWQILKNKIAHLFVAEYNNEILTADIIFVFKNKIYYAYSASKLEFKEVMAPTLLLWEIVRWGKCQSYQMFDLWGAEEGRGFSRFKEQFGADLVETAGSFDLPINKWLYPLFRVSEEVRWKILRLIK